MLEKDGVSRQVAEMGLQIEGLWQELGKGVIGQKRLLERMLMCLICEGHLLIEGVPGLAKTQSVKTLSKCLDLKFSRIQFTPDLLPADLIGTLIYNMPNNRFEVKKGPIFAHLVLADEINRAPAKVQSALLEAMEEKQVTIGENTHPLPHPFMVLATQNPLEQEGTYPLPEAQLDRFFMKVQIDYPGEDEELEIMRSYNLGFQTPKTVWGTAELEKVEALTKSIYVDLKIEQYALQLVRSTRDASGYGIKDLSHYILYGASPRGSIALVRAARVEALLRGRDFVMPEDVGAVAEDVLSHRIGISYDAMADNVSHRDIIRRVVERTAAP